MLQAEELCFNLNNKYKCLLNINKTGEVRGKGLRSNFLNWFLSGKLDINFILNFRVSLCAANKFDNWISCGNFSIFSGKHKKNFCKTNFVLKATIKSNETSEI